MNMTGAEIALIITACGTLATALMSGTGLIIGAMNSRRIAEVHKLTNSLAARAELGAEAIGNVKGRREQTAERQLESATVAKVETVVTAAIENVAEKSLDTAAGKVADKIVDKVMEKK